VENWTGGQLDRWTGDHSAERQAKHVSGLNYVITLGGRDDEVPKHDMACFEKHAKMLNLHLSNRRVLLNSVFALQPVLIAFDLIGMES